MDSSDNQALVPEEAVGKILLAVGQGQLLMRKKFEQFRGLIDDCEKGIGPKEVTVEDLQGFWELMYIQVEDIHKKFSELEELEKNSWEEAKPADVKNNERQPLGVLNKESCRVLRKKPASTKKDFSVEVKQRLAQAKALARKRLEEQDQTENIIC